METRLALIEQLERDGSVRMRHAVTHWPVRIGRAFDCEVVLDDPHVAAYHAELAPDDEGWLVVRTLDTVNGALLGARRLAAGQTGVLTDAGLLQLGQTRLRVRRPGESLAPERALAPPSGSGVRAVLVLAAVVMLLLFADHLLDLDPGAKITEMLPPLLGVAIGVMLWSGSWGLGSKLFQRHFVFLPHLRLALWLLLAITLADELLHGLAFALSWAWPSRIAPWIQLALVAVLVHAHLSLLLPALRRVLARSIALVFAAGMGVSMALTWQRTDRLFDELYTATLGPPMLRLAPAVEPARFLDEVRALKEPLDRHAREDAPGETADE